MTTGAVSWGPNTSMDVGLSRGGINKLYVGNGAAGNPSGTLIAATIGVGTIAPTNSLSFGGNSPRTLWMERHTTANTIGNDLTMQAGGATSSATDKNGGGLILSSGTSTGTGSSTISFQTATEQVSTNTTDNNPTTKMTILGNGNVGIGTASPIALLQIGTGTPTTAINGIQISSDSRTNLYRHNSSVIKTDGWLYGALGLIGESVQFNTLFPLGNNDLVIRTRTSGSNNIIFKSVGTTPSETMRMDTNGNVGIGMINPIYKLDVLGDINASGSVRTANVALMSDKRWKKDISPLKNSIEKIQRINGVSYYWAIDDFPEKHFTDKKQIGVVAQEVQKVFPELVLKDKQGFLSVNYPALIAPLIEAFKEQQKQVEENVFKFKTMQGEFAEIKISIDENKREIASLKAENAKLKARLEKIEKFLEKNK